MDRYANLLIGAAAADIGDFAVDIGIRRHRVLLEQRGDRHDHAALAIAALRHVVVDPGLLNFVQDAVLGECFDGRDVLADRISDLNHTRARGSAIDMHSAGAALRDAAAVLRARKPDGISDNP